MTEKLSGTCGTCRWEFLHCSVNDPDMFNFYIAPIDPQRGGVLDEWKDADEMGKTIPPWYDSPALDYGDILRVSISPGVKATTCKKMFAGFCTASKIDISGLDTSDVTDMSGMFSGCESLRSLDVSMLDTSSVTCMDHMFYDCKSLTSLDVSEWDVSNVRDTDEMFSGCWRLTSLDVSKWDVSSARSMEQMFRDCKALTSLDLSRWDAVHLIRAHEMFLHCDALTSLDVMSGRVSDEMIMLFIQGIKYDGLLRRLRRKNA